MLRIDYFTNSGEWTGAFYLDTLPRDLDKFAQSKLGDYFADWYSIHLGE